MMRSRGPQAWHGNGSTIWPTHDKTSIPWTMGNLCVKTDDIYLAMFPFGDVPGMKLRPVLLLTGKVGSVPEVVVAYISSAVPAAPLASDIIIDPTSSEAATTNLHVKSIVRLNRIATVHSKNVVRYLGHLPDTLSKEVDAKLRALLRI